MRNQKMGLGLMVLLTSCGTFRGAGGLMGATCSGDLGGTAGAQKVEAFIAAANSFATVRVDNVARAASMARCRPRPPTSCPRRARSRQCRRASS